MKLRHKETGDILILNDYLPDYHEMEVLLSVFRNKDIHIIKQKDKVLEDLIETLKQIKSICQTTAFSSSHQMKTSIEKTAALAEKALKRLTLVSLCLKASF